MYDVIIVGAGPAGLSAALILGRCRRRVLLCDNGQPRNAASHAVHGFFSRDGTPPRELLTYGREQLRPYTTVVVRDMEVTAAGCTGNGFMVTLKDGSRAESAKLLLATGVVDDLPEIAGIDRFYGRSVHHCPYCDGWEWRDQPIAVYGRGEKGAGLALMLTLWSHDVVLCTDGAGELSTEERARLGRNAIALREEPIARLEGSPEGQLECVVFADGAVLPRRALFFNTGQFQRSPLLAQLGCDFSAKGGAETGDFEETNVPGIYAVGDASRDVQLVVIAAAEGARAACAINKALLKEAGLL